jgi:prepilin-type N-terminal cleavage/methylation domain-containing protein
VKRGFTLIELLIVMGIIATLAGMMMPMYGIVRDAMQRTNTEAVIRKIDGGLRLFKTDWGTYPYQVSYPAGFSGAGFPNRLYYQIGTDISWAGGSASDADKVKADTVTAAAKYNDSSPTALTYVSADVGNTKYAGRLNACAREQVRLAVLAGNLGMRGPVITTIAGATTTDRRALSVLSGAEQTSSAKPGWASDYLRGELEKRFVSGDATLDAWGTPLVFINQTVPGIKMSVTGWPDEQIKYSNFRFGLGAIGFDAMSGPANAIVAAGRAQLLYKGRIRLSRAAAGDGQPPPTDATYFPNATELMQSDMRYYAPPGFEQDFELWSAGKDRTFSYMRGDRANRDNVAVIRYNKGIE